MKENLSGDGFRGESIYYEVTLNNRSNQAIENLKVEYRYYIVLHEQAKNREDITRQVSGSFGVPHLDAMSSITGSTVKTVVGRRIRSVQVRDRGGVVGYDELLAIRDTSVFVGSSYFFMATNSGKATNVPADWTRRFEGFCTR